MTWIPADDGLIAEDAPKKWRAGRYYKREQHAVICSRAVNVKYPCNVEFLSKSFKKFMTWHSPKKSFQSILNNQEIGFKKWFGVILFGEELKDISPL